MKKLEEGMRANDLEDLVLPMISVDEYESKVDDDAVVFGFFVSDHDAAQDLNRFIQKSPVPILDTEVSPAPDEHGYYFVFFEILSGDDLAENVLNLLDEVSGLVKIEHWQLRVRGKHGLIPFSKKVITHLSGAQEQGKEDELQEHILEFLKPSGLSHAEVNGDHLILEGMGRIGTFKIVAFGNATDIEDRFSLAESARDVALTDAVREIRLTNMLGEGWTVARVGGLSVLQHEDAETIMILSDE